MEDQKEPIFRKSVSIPHQCFISCVNGKYEFTMNVMGVSVPIENSELGQRLMEGFERYHLEESKKYRNSLEFRFIRFRYKLRRLLGK